MHIKGIFCLLTQQCESFGLKAKAAAVHAYQHHARCMIQKCVWKQNSFTLGLHAQTRWKRRGSPKSCQAMAWLWKTRKTSGKSFHEKICQNHKFVTFFDCELIFIEPRYFMLHFWTVTIRGTFHLTNDIF